MKWIYLVVLVISILGVNSFGGVEPTDNLPALGGAIGFGIIGAASLIALALDKTKKKQEHNQS